MKIHEAPRLFYLVPLLTLIPISPSNAAVLITDFSTTNPLTLAYGGSTWSSPNQFQWFTNGAVQGQEVVPLSGGSPTVSGGAYSSGLSLNLTGQNTLELSACLLMLNQATVIQVLLFDADGTHVRYDFPSSNFNTLTFASAYASMASGTTTAAGTTPGLDLTAITTYQVQGNYYDLAGSGTALFRVQFDQLSAIGTVPEPAAASLFAIGMLACSLRRCRK